MHVYYLFLFDFFPRDTYCYTCNTDNSLISVFTFFEVVFYAVINNSVFKTITKAHSWRN